MHSTAHPAGFWWRVLAYFIDTAIVSFASSIVSVILQFILMIPLAFVAIPLVEEGSFAEFLVFLFMLCIYVAGFLTIYWLYYALLEKSHLQGTLGKRALGMKVVRLDGEPVTFKLATKRFFARLIPFGYVTALFTPQTQALHDVLSKCIVTKE
ncbi:RDD family protein [Cytobacillus sp. FJAT-54145]|uniref:RDD family protein n=1 Tax=Cytobacillus spartinae TaxID=3299023 RepID=A0ABW6KDY0_9BACI